MVVWNVLRQFALSPMTSDYEAYDSLLSDI
jgi:hypothetical protein